MEGPEKNLMIGRQATGAMRCTQQKKNWLETSVDGVAEMANATETQAGGLDPDLSQKWLHIPHLSLTTSLVSHACSFFPHHGFFLANPPVPLLTHLRHCVTSSLQPRCASFQLFSHPSTVLSKNCSINFPVRYFPWTNLPARCKDRFLSRNSRCAVFSCFWIGRWLRLHMAARRKEFGSRNWSVCRRGPCCKLSNEQVALLSQFVHHLPNGRPCARFFSYQEPHTPKLGPVQTVSLWPKSSSWDPKMLDAQPLMMSPYPLPTWRHLGDLCVNEPKTKISSG